MYSNERKYTLPNDRVRDLLWRLIQETPGVRPKLVGLPPLVIACLTVSRQTIRSRFLVFLGLVRMDENDESKNSYKTERAGIGWAGI